MTNPFAALTELGYGDWTRHALRGDASSRQFLRLTKSPSAASDCVIAMFTPPYLSKSQTAFVEIAELLRGHGLSAPEILAMSGHVIVMEDLGQTDLATALRHDTAEEGALYRAAIDVMIRLRDVTPPSGLIRLTPDTGAKMLQPFFDFIAMQADQPHQEAIRAAIAGLLADHAGAPACLSLRDYHAENLIWRSERAGLDRIGIVDFQDAFLAPPEYDLVSLLRDARRDVSDRTRRDGVSYFAAETGQTVTDVNARTAILGIQRNLRILGIFARLAQRDGKEGYLKLIPRVRQHILDDLEHPVAQDLRPALIPLLETKG